MRKWKILIEQDDNVIEVDSDEYLYLLKILGYDSEILAETPPYEGNKIIINGNLDLSNTPTTSLHNVIRINGKLDMRYSKISDISNIKVPEHWVSDYGSTRYINHVRKIKQEKLSSAQERRENNEWDLDNPDIDEQGIRANVVFMYFKELFPSVRVKTSDDSEKLINLNNKIEQLLQLEKQYESEGRDLTDIYAEIEVTEEEINEINSSIDVYNFIPQGGHYNLDSFEFVSDDDLSGYEFAIGTTDEADSSLRDYFEEYVDNPKDFFSPEKLENYVDVKRIGEMAREYYEEAVRDSPDSYFDSDEYELSDDDQERLDELNEELEEYKERLEMYPHDSPEHEQIIDHIEDLENEIEELEESKEISESQIENKIDELVDEVEDNPMYFIREFGFDPSDYIDTDELLDDLVNESDYGTLNGWDGSYTEIKFNNENYVVMNYSR